MIVSRVPTLTLPGGQIPVVGLGTWQSEGGAAERAVTAALQLGYRTSTPPPGTATRRRSAGRSATIDVDRDDVFVTTKLPPGPRRPCPSARSTRVARGPRHGPPGPVADPLGRPDAQASP